MATSITKIQLPKQIWRTYISGARKIILILERASNPRLEMLSRKTMKKEVLGGFTILTTGATNQN